MGCGCDMYGTLIMDMGTGSEWLSKPKPRPGLSAMFSLDVLEKQGSASFEVEIWDRDKNGTWALAAAFSSITTTGVYTKYISGLKQLIRWRCRIDAAGDPDRVTVAAMQGQGLP